MIEIGNWGGDTHFDIPGPDGPVRVTVIESSLTYKRRKRQEARMSKTVKTGSMGNDIEEMKRIEKPKKGTKKK